MVKLALSLVRALAAAKALPEGKAPSKAGDRVGTARGGISAALQRFRYNVGLQAVAKSLYKGKAPCKAGGRVGTACGGYPAVTPEHFRCSVLHPRKPACFQESRQTQPKTNVLLVKALPSPYYKVFKKRTDMGGFSDNADTLCTGNLRGHSCSYRRIAAWRYPAMPPYTVVPPI